MPEPYVMTGLVGAVAAVVLVAWVALLAIRAARSARAERKATTKEKELAQAIREAAEASAERASEAQRLAKRSTPEGIGRRIRALEDRLALVNVWPSFKSEVIRQAERKVHKLEERVAELESAAAK